MKTCIRRAKIQDAEGIHLAHMKSIQEVCSKDYSLEEIKAWGHRPYREEKRLESIKNDLIWVVDDKGSIEGYGHLKFFPESNIGHIFGLYLTPKVLGHNFGKSIIDRMIVETRKARVPELTLKATLTAHNFYLKMGFIDDGPETSIEINGQKVRCYPMKMEFKIY